MRYQRPRNVNRTTVGELNDVVELLKREEAFRGLVLEFTNVVKTMLILLASTCTAERSFSD